LHGVVGLPVLLWGQTDAGAIGSAALVAAAEGRGRGPSHCSEFCDRAARGHDVRLQLVGVSTVNQSMVHSGNWILPDQYLCRHLCTEVALNRSHIAVGQFVPGAGKSIGELIGILVEPARNLFVGRIHAHAEVCGQHGGLVTLSFVVRIRHQICRGTAFGNPLGGPCRALAHLPLKTKEVFEVVVAPLRGRRGPDALQSTGDGVGSCSSSKGVLPPCALLGDGGSSRLGPNVLAGVGCTVGLAKGVSPCDQGHGFLVVHRHATKRLADVAGRSHGIRIAIWPLRVHVNESHLHRSQGVLQLALSFIALVCQPLRFASPVNIFLGLPDIRPSTGEAKGFETHALQGNVARQDHQVGPRDLPSVLLLDGPQQTAGFVQVGIVWPAVQRRKAEHTCSSTAPTIADAIRSRAVPSHPDEEGTVVPPVGGPPFLGIGHKVGEVLLDRRQIEGLEFFGVIKRLSHGIGHARVHAKNTEVELIGPPIGVSCTAAGTMVQFPIHKGTLGHISVHMIVHVVG